MVEAVASGPATYTTSIWSLRGSSVGVVRLCWLAPSVANVSDCR
jgi:hypothetical protein